MEMCERHSSRWICSALCNRDHHAVTRSASSTKASNGPLSDFGDFMRAKCIDLAVLDGLLDGFAPLPTAAPAPAPAPSAETETVTETCRLCLWTPGILSVEPRSISIPHPLDADPADRVQQVHILGWGFQPSLPSSSMLFQSEKTHPRRGARGGVHTRSGRAVRAR
jgi:hypothetical protein